jgi:hypothetical protein
MTSIILPAHLNDPDRFPLTTKRWTPMRDIPEQVRLGESPARFKVVPAGRRSGKTERAKRHVVRSAMDPRLFNFDDPQFACAAPTFNQAKSIYWKDLKRMIPTWMKRRTSETDLQIDLITGAMIRVVGMDKPERIEGSPWDGIILDEYANMKPGAWEENVLPALTDRKGWGWLIGVPEGRNHYYDLYKNAQGPWNIRNEGQDWDAFTWKSIEIMEPAEIELRRSQMDELTFKQEYEASFINFAGQAYYPFLAEDHCAPLLQHYNPKAELIFCLDFNVDPGIAVICQEMELPERKQVDRGIEVGGKKLFGGVRQAPKVHGTAIIGEVYIPRNSNTPAVCRKLAADWGDHQGPISVYGDATGGARTTQSETGASDWDIVKENLYRDFSSQQVTIRLNLSDNGKPMNMPERHRVNAVNSRLKTDSGIIRLMVDGAECPMTVKDFEGVRLLEGGSGELDKKHDPKLTHLTDGVGYYIAKAFPLRREVATRTELSR